uniref:G-protein coupled receptors family 1 profile domain-containing protein n=1 Tax=Globodera rostochiensis TaxID=31243 RepID=A0A914HFT8_GLORO
MAYNVSADLWFQYFNEDGPQIWILTIAFGARSAWAILGIVFNIGLIYVTICNNSLHGSCNILLAMESFFATTMNATYLVSFVVVVCGLRFIRYQYCFPIIILPGNVLGNCAQMTMVFTGLERLQSVLFPIWYKKRSTKTNISLASLLLVGYSTYQFNIYYIAYQDNMDLMVSCSTTEIIAGKMAAQMNVNGYTLSAILMGTYTLIWVLVFKLRVTAKNVSEKNIRLAKSLMFIIGFNMVGVFIKCIGLFLFQYVTVNVFVNANSPLLYLMSTEYRTRFNQHFPWLQKLVGKNTVVTTVSSVQSMSSSTISKLRQNSKQSGGANATRTFGNINFARVVQRSVA